MPPARGAAKYQEGEPVLCFQGGLIYEAKVQALQKEEGATLYSIHYKGWNKTWDECVPEDRLLKMTPTNLQKQKEVQLAAKQKKSEADTAKTKKAETETKQKKTDLESCPKVKKSDGSVKLKKSESDGQKLAKTESVASKPARSGTPPVGAKRTSSSSAVGGKNDSSSFKRGTKRGLVESECTIKEVRLNVQRLKKLKSRSTSESSSASGQSSSEDLSSRLKRRPQRAAALVPKVKLEEDDVREEVKEKPVKRKKATSKIRAATPDVSAGKGKAEEPNQLCGPAFGSEIELPLPQPLKNLLVDDFDLISRQRKTLMLPARINVADFIQSFCEERRSVEVEEVCKGLRSYFDSTLGTQLLYKFERIQYSDIMKEHPGVLMSKLYPPIHLLRLLTRLPNLLATANLDPQALSGLISTLTLLVNSIDDRKGELFKKEDYGTASPEYHRRAL